MNPPAETAVGRGDDPLPADQVREAKNALGDELGVLDDIGGVADHAGQNHPAVRQFDVLPELPFVFVADIAGLERIGMRIHRQHDIDDVAHRDVGDVGSVPAAPAQMEADAVLRQAADRVVERLDPDHRELLVLFDRRLRIDHVPVLGDCRIIELEDEAGVEDRLVLLAHRIGAGVEELLLGLVI